MQRKIVEQGNRNAASRLFHAKSEKDTITAWKQDLMRVLQVFNVCSDPFRSTSADYLSD